MVPQEIKKKLSFGSSYKIILVLASLENYSGFGSAPIIVIDVHLYLNSGRN
jgi:hypothetical protein